MVDNSLLMSCQPLSLLSFLFYCRLINRSNILPCGLIVVDLRYKRYGGLFMNTITIDNNTYNNIVRYAQLNNISVSEAVVTGLNTFLEKFKEKVSTKEKYYISPEVKALEVGFVCPQDFMSKE